MAEGLLRFTPCGLVFDAIGISFLGYAFFVKSMESIVQEAGTYWSSNPYVLRSIISSKFDGIWGSVLLLIGFIYQAFGYGGAENQLVVVLSYDVLILFVVAYCIFLRKWLIGRWVSAIERIVGGS